MITQPLCIAQQSRPKGLGCFSPFLVVACSTAGIHLPALRTPRSAILVLWTRFASSGTRLLHSTLGKAVFPPHQPFSQHLCLQAYTSSPSASGLQATFQLLRSKLAPWRLHSNASITASSSSTAGFFIPPKPLQGCSLRSRSFSRGSVASRVRLAAVPLAGFAHSCALVPAPFGRANSDAGARSCSFLRTGGRTTEVAPAPRFASVLSGFPPLGELASARGRLLRRVSRFFLLPSHFDLIWN